MPTHRKPRTPLRPHGPAVGVTTAAIASVTLLSGQAVLAPSAQAAPAPSVEEVQRKVDELYRQAGTATQRYDRAKEAAGAQRDEVGRILDDVARRTESMNATRRALGGFAAAQYREGAVSPTAALIFADSPGAYFDQTQLMDRLTARQRSVLGEFEEQQKDAAARRAKATAALERLTASQAALRDSKREVQDRLGEARQLLARLTAKEKARLAELERERQAQARREAEAKARAEAERARREEAAREEAGTPPPARDDGAYGTKAEKALAFARAQIGKPYVWGATGPGSYDCSGLTQAAWRAAGVDLPRTTWDQVEVGTRVATADLRPGDLVFFYDDISHVGLYIGGGRMIHAPKPGAYVREESIYTMPVYGSVRPA
ncbi:NlpC/P60 family protein [Streptomyces sp. NPDC001941]|uniref:C40 family peptidase n=1 Tax=Streptomyces sp. NPDC001941 TaxID=3154659 RepID=UPI00333148D9